MTGTIKRLHDVDTTLLAVDFRGIAVGLLVHRINDVYFTAPSYPTF